MAQSKVVYIIKEMEMGGTQTHLLQVLSLLDRDRFLPILYCLSGKGPLLENARALNVSVVSGGMKKFSGMHAIRGILRLRRFLADQQPDVVHNYLLRANFLGSIAARLAGVPLVLCSKRGCHERRGRELASVKLSNWLAHGVTTNAEAVRDFVQANEGCPRDKMVVIPSGIDTERFRPLPGADYKSRIGIDTTRPVVGVVTRSRVRKGVEEYLRAIIRVRERVKGVQAVVVGEVELDSDLREIVRQGGLKSDLHLLGRRSDMPEVYSAFDIFVLSSHDEGMSNAMLEAMAMGKPVVATDVGGTGEVVRHGISGLLVPARDPEPLASAILELVQSPDRCRLMGSIGREIVEDRFSARSMVRQMEEYYLMKLSPTGAERTRLAAMLAR